jgi:hypothetical protein
MVVVLLMMMRLEETSKSVQEREAILLLAVMDLLDVLDGFA